MEQTELNDDAEIEIAFEEFVADRRHVDYDDEKPDNQYKLLQYLVHNEIPVNSESLHLAYLEVRSQGQLELFPQQGPLTAPMPAPIPNPVSPHAPAPIKTVHKNYRNGLTIDDLGRVIRTG